MPTTARRPRSQLRVVELEGRLAPAVYDVTFHGPAAGIEGSTAAAHTGGLALTGGAPQGADTARVTAATAADAVRAVLSGSVTATLDGKVTTYTFGPTTASGNRADQKPYFVFLPDGRTGFVRLEDMAGTPSKADWDYNDRGWRVGVRPVGGLTVGGGGPQPQGGDPSGGDPPPSPPPPPPPITGSATLYDMFDQSANVSWNITFPSADKMHWQYTVVNNDINVQSPVPNNGIVSFYLPGQPAGFAAPNTSLAGWNDPLPTTPSWSRAYDDAYFRSGTATFEFQTKWQPAAMGDALAGGGGRVPSLAVGMVMGPAPTPTVSVQVADLIPLNADNDNKSAWLSAAQPFIPSVRDFDATNLPQDDMELVAGTVAVTNHGFEGGLTLSNHSQVQEGEVRFWKDRRKQEPFTGVHVAGSAKPVVVPFFAEGYRESLALLDTRIEARFVDGNDLLAVYDYKKVTVTPVVQNLKGSVPVPGVFPGSYNGGQGVRVGDPNGLNLGDRAALFLATVTVSGGMDGGFVQNVYETLNGVHADGAGWQTATAFRNLVLKGGIGASWPLLDALNAGKALTDPRYDATKAGTADPNTFDYLAADSPGVYFTPAAWGNTAKVDTLDKYRMTLVVRYDDGSLYSLAHVDWYVQFYATGSGGGVPPTVKYPSDVTVADGGWVRNSDDPEKTAVPVANESLEWV